MFTLSFWKAACERAAKSGAQAALGAWVASDGGVGNLFDLDAGVLFGSIGFGVGISLLTSLASGALPVGASDSPSLTKADPG